MKSMIYLFIVIVSLATQIVHAQWSRLQTGYDGNLKSAFFTSVDTGYIVGGSTILRTMDGGRTWSSQVLSEGVDQSINTVFFPTKSVGYAAGKIIYKTTNEGESWDSVHAITEVPSAKEFRSMFFKDDLNGYVVGDGIRFTSDGGTTWNIQTFHPSLPVSCNTAHFVGDGIGFIGGWTGTSGGMFGIVAKTVDWGKTWVRSLAMEDISEAFRIKAIKLITPLNAWIVGSRESSGTPYSESRIIHTTDGGTTWEPINVVFTRTLNTIASAGSQILYVGDEWGDIYSTMDGGLSWNRDEVLSGGRSINSIVTVDNRVAYAVATSGLAFKRSVTTSVTNTFPNVGIRISPNPSHDRVVVSIDPLQFPNEFSHIAIFNALGKDVFQSLHQPHFSEYDFGALPKGVYFVQVRNGMVAHTLKLLLN